MRIVLVGPAYPYRGGIAHFTNRLAQALDAAGHEVLLLTFSRQYPALLFPGKTQFEKTPWKLPNRPVRLIDSVNPFSWWKAGQWLAHQHPEVVVLMHWMPFFVPAYLGLLRAMRRAMPPRALPKVALLLHTVWPHQRFPLTKHLMKALIQRADTFVTLSEHLTEELRGFAPEAEVAEGFHPVYDHFHAPIDPAVAGPDSGLGVRYLLQDGYKLHSFLQWPHAAGLLGLVVAQPAAGRYGRAGRTHSHLIVGRGAR